MRTVLKGSLRSMGELLGWYGRARRIRAAGMGVERCEERLLLTDLTGQWNLELTSPLPPPDSDPGPYGLNLNPDGRSTISLPGEGLVPIDHLKIGKKDTFKGKIKTGDLRGKVRGVLLPPKDPHTLPKFDITLEMVKPLDQLYDFEGVRPI